MTSFLDAHFQEWLSLTFRWLHMITGIAWIGASFYFNWLEHHLNRQEGLREGIAGDLWAVHGGGFYYLEKYKVGPPTLPKVLHWFKWEAYFTWITGFCLLVVVYYLKADSLLIDPQVKELTPAAAIRISLLSLAGGWLFYDVLCRSPLGRHNAVLGVTFFMFMVGAAYGLLQTFGARAAYLHVGAMIGTIMVANVFTVIIPSQKRMVRAAAEGQAMDPEYGRRALQRSLHNNYLTLPVLFIMISNHYPMTFAHAWNWQILIALSVIGIGVRHYFNVRKKSAWAVWVLPVAVIGMGLLAYTTRPAPVTATDKVPSFVQVAAVFANRCLPCHSRHATDDVFTVAPNGVMFDTPGEIRSKADLIKVRTIDTESMPLANKTGMTASERALIGAWIAAGSPID